MGEQMSDKSDEQLSALMDGELAELEYDLLTRRVASDDSLRERWGRYQLASAALRRDLPPVVDLGLVERLAATLDATAPRAKLPVEPARSWHRPAAGFAVAASVAAVALLGLELGSDSGARGTAVSGQLAQAESSASSPVVQPLAGTSRQSESLARATTTPDLQARMQGLLYMHAGQVPGSLLGDTRMVVHEAQR